MAARVLTIAQQKGGAGKTTLAAHLAVAWSLAGYRVAVVDIDPQASLTQWDRMRGERTRGGAKLASLHVVSIAGWRLAGEVDRLRRDYDIVLVDSPPHMETEAKIAVRAADLVIVPVQPSPMDLWATQGTLDLIKKERRSALIVLNRVPARASLTAAMRARVEELGVSCAQATIGSRVALASSLLEGRGIGEAAPSSAAGLEISALAKEVWLAASGQGGG
jgi:chromosome partitioning protein